MPQTVVMITPYVEPVRGGITSFVRNLSSELTMKGVDVMTLSRQGTPRPGVEVIEGNIFGFIRRATTRIRGLKPDAIHAHAHWYALQAAIGARGPSTKVVFSFHTAWNPRGMVRRKMLDRLLQKSDYVTFPSQYLRDASEWDLPDRMIRVVHPGARVIAVDPQDRNRMRQELGLSACRGVIGYVGQFHWPEKARGFGILLKAIARPSLRDACLIAAGGGLFLEEARKLSARLGIARRVWLLGEVPDPSLIYAACDVYCHASLQETIGLAILEAMGYACPIVGFRRGFIEETITDGKEGLVADVEVDALADALARLLDDPALSKRLGIAAQQKARSEFAWSRSAGKFIELYGAVI